MKNKTNLLTRIKNILREVRFGNLTGRLNPDGAEDKEFINDFNNMLEALQDRENMLKENQGIVLAKSEYLKTLLDMLNEGVISVSRDFKILSLNKTQALWFGQKNSKLVGQSLENILKKYKIYDEKNKPITKSLEEFFEKNKTNCILTFELRKSRNTFSVTIKKFLDKDKNVNYFIIAKDISSDIKLQKLKDTFVATLTHDLKVPIVAEEKVLNLFAAETLGKVTDLQKEALENMLSNNKDMQGLVSTLLDVYKLDDGVFKLIKTNFNISKLAAAEVEKLKFIAAEADLKIKVNDRLKNSFITADEAQIGRVIKNLLTNAINFAPQNSAILLELSENAGMLKISVTDYGAGISKENLPHVFDRYFTSDKKYRKVGTGLGLFLSKKIIGLHGGDVKVESIPDKKTVFTIELPL